MQKELLSPPRAIQTSEELLLLIKIFESQGRNEEIVKILDKESLGIKSRIVQNDWFFIRAKVLNLEKAGLWTDGLGFAQELLTVPGDDEAAKAALQERDDWGVWELLLSATKKINNAE
jgi:N-terminal acetyltransferase B complex non-catalytic subunit